MSSTVFLPNTKRYPHPRKWSLEHIWEISNDIAIENISVDYLWDKMYKDIYVWLDENEELSNKHFIHHMGRVLEADMNYPIVLSEEDYILDGVHRLLKAKYYGLKTITCRRFITDPVPNVL